MELLFLGLFAIAGGVFLLDDNDDEEDVNEEPDEPTLTTFGDLTLSETAEGDATVYGTDGDDVFASNSGDGAALDDYAFDNGLQMNALHAGDGDDTIHTTYYDSFGNTDPAPTVFGEAGDDSIHSQWANVDGGEGNDNIDILVQPHSGSDIVQIGEGGDGNDVLHARSDLSGHQVVPSGNFELHGGAGDDTLSGYAGEFFGDEGNDSIAVDGTFPDDASVEGGAGDDTISVDRMVHFYSRYDDDTSRVEFDDGNFEVSGDEGADRFEVNADIRYVQDGLTPAILTTITDFDPDEDVLSFTYETGETNPYVSGFLPQTDTVNHNVSFAGLFEASDGSYTDVMISVTGEDASDSSILTQDFAVRLEGVTNLDPNSVTLDPINGEILIG